MLLRHFVFIFALGSVFAAETNPPPGTLLEVYGHKMHIHCAGKTNAPVTVVFESGGGGTAKDWNKVRELLGPTARTCAYDHAGLGFSENGPAPRTMRHEAFELHALLERANVTGPIVLVGQSIGGLLADVFARSISGYRMGVRKPLQFGSVELQIAGMYFIALFFAVVAGACISIQ